MSKVSYTKKVSVRKRLAEIMRKNPRHVHDDRLLWILYLREHCHFYSEVFERVIMDENTPTMGSLDRTRRKILLQYKKAEAACE